MITKAKVQLKVLGQLIRSNVTPMGPRALGYGEGIHQDKLQGLLLFYFILFIQNNAIMQSLCDWSIHFIFYIDGTYIYTYIRSTQDNTLIRQCYLFVPFVTL